MKLKPINLTAMLLAASAVGGSASAADQHRAGASTVSASNEAKRLPEIPLDGRSGPNTEQWGNIWGVQGVRNVSHATLTPFLPPAGIATGAAVVVAPGGAFVYLSIDSEGYGVARWLASKGIAAFVLKYRVRPTPRDPKVFTDMAMEMLKKVSGPNAPVINIETPPEAFADGQAALRLVRSKAATFGVDPKRIGFVGFSAGGKLAMTVALADNVADRPDFVGNLYGPMEACDVPSDAPPLFIGLALDDPLGARGQLGLMNSWRLAKRPVEAHFYGIGGHGFGMDSKGAATALWTDEMYAWLKDRGLLTPTDKR